MGENVSRKGNDKLRQKNKFRDNSMALEIDVPIVK
jgi:hypothetical protein